MTPNEASTIEATTASPACQLEAAKSLVVEAAEESFELSCQVLYWDYKNRLPSEASPLDPWKHKDELVINVGWGLDTEVRDMWTLVDEKGELLTPYYSFLILSDELKSIYEPSTVPPIRDGTPLLVVVGEGDVLYLHNFRKV